MRNLQVSFNNVDDSRSMIVSLAGQLTAMNANNFRNDLLSVIQENPKDCYIDISSLQSLDATGVNVLLTAHNSIAKKGCKLVIISSSECPANEFLHLTKFNKYLNLERA